MYLETNNLIIRELELDDVNSYIEMASDGSLYDIFGDCSNCNKWMIHWIEDARVLYQKNDIHSNYLAYAIVNKFNGRAIGSVGCSYYDDLKKVGITYFIGKKFRHKGFASEAVKVFTKYFFNQYKEKELIATIRTENVASCKTVEHAGFKLTETKKYKDINDTNEIMQKKFANIWTVAICKVDLQPIVPRD